MRRDDLAELHYITPIANLASIMRHGLLSHRRAERHRHQTVALAEVQEKRAAKRVPQGRPLHEYVNLYFCARDPMLCKRLNQRHEICVLSISPDVLDIDGVVVTDVNAASPRARFGAGAAGLEIVDRSLTYAEYWTDPDIVEQWRRSRAKCAEVLVPDRVVPAYIRRAYVCRADVADAVGNAAADMPAQVNCPLFFNRS